MRARACFVALRSVYAMGPWIVSANFKSSCSSGSKAPKYAKVWNRHCFQ